MRHRFLSLLLCLGAVVTLYAQKPDIVIPLWPEGAPTSNGYEQPEKDFGDHVSYVTQPELWVFLPEHCCGIAVMGIPGGGYWDVWYQHEGIQWAEWYRSQGIIYAVLKYRLPNGHREVPLDDSQQAMLILRQHSREWGYEKVGVMGCSAGGHLAAMTSTHYTTRENRPDFQILFYPVITLDPTYTHEGTMSNLLGQKPSKKLIEQFSNEKCVTADTPPAFILASTDDKVVPVRNSLEYYNALLAHGVSATMHLYPIGGHGWAWKESFPYKPQYISELSQWLHLTQIPRRRVLYIGDSITDGGWGRSGGDMRPSEERNKTDMNHVYGHSYVMFCASRYQADYPEERMSFWNRGISGNTLDQMADLWDQDCLSLQPNVVSILIGTNDAHLYLEQKEKALKADSTAQIPAFDILGWETRYRTLLDRTRDSLPTVQFVLCTPFVAKAGWVGQSANYREREALVKLLAEAVRRIAADYHAILVPYDEMFSRLIRNNSNGDRSYWIWDGIHPTPAGHEKMAELWMERVQLIQK